MNDQIQSQESIEHRCYIEYLMSKHTENHHINMAHNVNGSGHIVTMLSKTEDIKSGSSIKRLSKFCLTNNTVF